MAAKNAAGLRTGETDGDMPSYLIPPSLTVFPFPAVAGVV